MTPPNPEQLGEALDEVLSYAVSQLDGEKPYWDSELLRPALALLTQHRDAMVAGVEAVEALRKARSRAHQLMQSVSGADKCLAAGLVEDISDALAAAHPKAGQETTQ